MSEPERITLDGVTPGMELGDVVYGPLERVDIVRYAGASGDFNPIHTDEGYARATGAPTVFAMGMLPAGYLAHAVSDWFGGPQHLRRYKVRFTTRVWPGDEIVCRGRVESIDGRVVHVRLEAARRGPGPDGLELAQEETAIVGEADVELPE
ncbi:MAG TPA: MaoC/PaaZ C-terminal domain-containing protein [Actinomycetota bacterium]|nr:MaoC/PaaZ C-terminal domain-containing protein [Actinomycetota bacterium]